MQTVSMRTRPKSCAAGVVTLSLLLLACSGSDDDAAPSDASVVATEADQSPTTTGGAEVSATDATSVAVTSGESIATVPTEGVPGLESDDAFCRSWSEFGGTFQALAAASNFASDPVTAVEAEVAAAAVLVGAVETMRANYPSAVSDETELFLDDLLGPLTRRAEKAQQALLDAGLTPDQIEALGDVWLTTLSASGLGDPDITLDVPADVSTGFDEAVVAFSANVPLIAADPSLVTNVEAPATQQYIAVNCPDQGTLGGNDFVGD